MRKPPFWAAVVGAVLAPFVATGLAVAVNVATGTSYFLPSVVASMRAHPVWWVAGLTGCSVALAVLMVWWHRRLELADDGDEAVPDVSISATAGPGGLAMVGDIGAVGVVAGTYIHHDAAGVPPLAPGRVVNLPPRNRGFTGRDELLGSVLSGFRSGPVAVVAVHGLGGIGKSQLALEFAHRGVAEGRYEVAWWVRAESPVTLAEDLAALAPGLGLPVVADVGQMVAGVRAVLHGRAGWLVVFDNAPDLESVHGWVPDGAGDVLLTSRTRLWQGLAKAVNVSVFTRRESVSYLERATGQSGPALDELAALLGDLPLALSQAAAFIRRSDGVSVAKYSGFYRDQRAAGELLAQVAGDGYPHSVATTWLVHIDWLTGHQPAGLELLQLVSGLNPDSINLSVLLSQPELLSEDLYPHLRQACAAPLGVTAAVTALTSSGLVTRIDDDRISMHRLVAQVTRNHPHSRQRPAHTVTLLAQLMPQTPWEPQHWPLCAELVAHITTATTHTETPDTAAVLTRLSQYLIVKAELQPAKTALTRALAIKEAVYGPDHPQVATPLGNLGIVEQELGELGAARASQARALAIFEAVYGPDHPQVATTLGNLGNVEQELGELGAARATLTRALAIFEAVYGPDHPQVATTLGNLGNVEQELGELGAARATLTRALAIFEAVYGPDHPQVATTLTNLGNIEQQLGELGAARATLTRALAIFEAVYGPDHPHTQHVARKARQIP